MKKFYYKKSEDTEKFKEYRISYIDDDIRCMGVGLYFRSTRYMTIRYFQYNNAEPNSWNWEFDYGFNSVNDTLSNFEKNINSYELKEVDDSFAYIFVRNMLNDIMQDQLVIYNEEAKFYIEEYDDNDFYYKFYRFICEYKDKKRVVEFIKDDKDDKYKLNINQEITEHTTLLRNRVTNTEFIEKFRELIDKYILVYFK